MTNRQYQKLFMIYTFIKCGESNVRMFDAVMSGNKVDLGRKFGEYAEQENNEFLKSWRKENNIRFSEWKVLGDGKMRTLGYDKNGTPIIVKRVSKGN